MEIVKHIPIINKHYYAIKESKEALFNFYQNQVNEHQQRIDHDSEPTDYVEAFLREKAKKEAEGNEDAQFYRYKLFDHRVLT
uniref:Uncharacterized protein n=1 Tax=Acrobeloides nanus TaxID=290746 RepID=A0A914EEW6_9BILA